MAVAPCKDCKERKRLIARDIYSCHSFCKLYIEYDKERKRIRQAKADEYAIKDMQAQGYRRTTRNQYQKYNKR